MKYFSGVFGTQSTFVGNHTRSFYWYVARFIGIFLLLYFGTLLIIGLSSKDNHYSPFVARYLDYITPLRRAVLSSANSVVRLLGFQTRFTDQYTVVPYGGRGVRMVYSCVGYGVMSFWAAFVLANRGSFFFKLRWAFTGLIALFVLNFLRISLLLLADVRHWDTPFGIDHHTLFNFVAYGLIFWFMYLYSRSRKNRTNLSADEN